ncbi:MAG: ATP-binding protein [Bryobacteraceae bacterium]
MLHRSLALPLHRAVQLGTPVLLQGPRSSGKTTLLQREFPAHTYVALDNAGDRARAREDPSGFIARLRGPAIIDDLHRAPQLADHLARSGFSSPLILVSSRRVKLPFETFELYPPTRAELERRPPLPLEMLGRFAAAAVQSTGPAARWPTRRGFMESDVRDLVNVHDLDRFELFLRVAQSQSGHLLDQQALANRCAISHRTVVRWLEVLDLCFLTLRLRPADLDFGRRLVRGPKLHFLDSESFESQVVSEIYRNAHHAGNAPDLRYWRDSNGFEIPLIVQNVMPVAIAATPTPEVVTRLRRWMELARTTQAGLIGRSVAPARSGGVVRYSIEQL